MNKTIKIGTHTVGADAPVFIVAEMSANHMHDYHRALEILHAAKEAGADAVKLQTYLPDTITVNSENQEFQINQGTIWDGTTLYKLYEEAYTPWEWHQPLAEEAKRLGMECFSSPFDFSAVDLMESLDMPAYKIASYEINDIPLIRKIARLHKPIIFATGVAHLEDIDRALRVCREEGNEDVVLLKCVSTYPTPYEDIHLNMIPTLGSTFNCVMGLSDHSMGSVVPVTSIALGVRMVEKHLTLRRSDGGPDGAFSMEPDEFAQMVHSIRIAESALGRSDYFLTPNQELEHEGARSLYAVADIRKGEELTPQNIRSIRPGNGLHTMYYEEILGKKACRDISCGTALRWDLFR